MRIGLIADIHANAPALAAVLAALRREGVDEIVCLGDVVGYNAEPDASVDLLRATTDRVVFGNHDFAVLHGDRLDGTNSAARTAIAWTRACLSPAARAWLAALPARLVSPGRYVAVHGCFLHDDHYHGYVTGAAVRANLDAVAARPDWPTIAFCGHTHLPMCGWLEGQIVHSNPLLRAVRWPAEARAVLINPGSVGQPRDRDPRAAAAVVDLERREVTPIRCDYDLARTTAAIRSAGLPGALAERLRLGV